MIFHPTLVFAHLLGGTAGTEVATEGGKGGAGQRRRDDKCCCLSYCCLRHRWPSELGGRMGLPLMSCSHLPGGKAQTEAVVALLEGGERGVVLQRKNGKGCRQVLGGWNRSYHCHPPPQAMEMAAMQAGEQGRSRNLQVGGPVRKERKRIGSPLPTVLSGLI